MQEPLSDFTEEGPTICKCGPTHLGATTNALVGRKGCAIGAKVTLMGWTQGPSAKEAYYEVALTLRTR